MIILITIRALTRVSSRPFPLSKAIPPITIKAVQLLFALATILDGNLASGQAPMALRCEGQTKPLGIEEVRPQVSWQLPWSYTGARQTAYQLVTAEDPGFQKILWNSGKVEFFSVPTGGHTAFDLGV